MVNMVNKINMFLKYVYMYVQDKYLFKIRYEYIRIDMLYI